MDIETLEKFMRDLSQEEYENIISPYDIAKLEKMGAKFEEKPILTIDEMFEIRKQMYIKIVPLLPTVPQWLEPSMKMLYQEIMDCIAFGVYGAAITMCSIFIEFVLKRATCLKECGGYQIFLLLFGKNLNI